MDPRPPVSLPRFPDPGFGPFDGEALTAENARLAAGAAFGSVRCQAAILLASILSLGLAGSLFWAQLARYEAALAACAGV